VRIRSLGLEYIKLNFPDLKSVNKKKITEQLFGNQSSELRAVINKSLYPKYLFWDKAKYLKSSYLSPEELWYVIKITRRASAFYTPVKTQNNESFVWCKIFETEELLHAIDLNSGGLLKGNYSEHTQGQKYKFISRGILEEAIASSQLEGANTTRKYAKKIIREGIKPRTKSEHMIVNNYIAMNRIEDDYQNKKLSIELLYEMHEQITKNTIPTEDLRRLRNDKDAIVVLHNEHTVAFEPPQEKVLKRELDRFIKFSNNELGHSFIHPVIKAIIIHFWFAYLHPFVDGNGRMARLLFYWYLIKAGYWGFAYLPISAIIKKSRISYEKAFIYTEQDDNDLTYFIDYNLAKIKQALSEFQNYVNRKSNEFKSMNRLNKFQLNTRQISLLNYLIGDLDSRTTTGIHMNINSISRRTAEKDLKGLLIKKLLITEKIGRMVYYFPPKDLYEKLC
jgi:Fic family protein